MNDFLPEGKINNLLLKNIIDEIKNDSTSNPRIGEDAAEISIQGKKEILVSSDPITFDTDEIGTYLIDICSNDIYASGGIPKWLLLTCLIPINTSFKEVRESLLKVFNRAEKHNIDIVGGHTEITSSVNKIILSGTVIGTYNKKYNSNLKITSNQDIILGGLAGVEGSKIISSSSNDKFMELEKLSNFSKDLSLSVKDISITAVNTKKVIKMHDPTEGGIATAIHEITEFGNVGCEIIYEKINFVNYFEETCKKLNLNPLGVISSGCLIIITEKQNSNSILKEFEKNLIPSSVIGKTTNKEKGNIINKDGEKSNLKRFDQDEIIKIFK